MVPTIVYGTAWKEDATERCVTNALRAGFRAIDTANQRKHYYEAGVGAALLKFYNEASIGRAELFLQTKFTHRAGQDDRLPYDPKADMRTMVIQSFESSLQHLNTDYIDSYVLHGPSTRPGLASEDWEAWRAMEEIHVSGRARFLGICHVIPSQLRELLANCKVKPSFVQNRCYAARGWDRSVRELCKDNEVRYQAFSLLTANQWIFAHPQFRKVLSTYGCTPAQLVFAFALKAEMIALTGTTDPKHMAEDLDACLIEISEADKALLETLDEEK